MVKKLYKICKRIIHRICIQGKLAKINIKFFKSGENIWYTIFLNFLIKQRHVSTCIRFFKKTSINQNFKFFLLKMHFFLQINKKKNRMFYGLLVFEECFFFKKNFNFERGQ